MQNLTKHTFFAYALQQYNNPSCSGVGEFQEDLLRIKYIKRLMHRYARTGRASGRLILNHLTGMNNVFRPEAVARILFFRTSREAWPALKTSLEFLGLMPEVVSAIDGRTILNTDVPLDTVLWGLLQDTVNPHAETR